MGFENGTLSAATAEALCVIIKHKSISSFEICHSDSRVKQAKAFSFYKAAANRSLDVH